MASAPLFSAFSQVRSSKLRSASGTPVLDNGWEMVEVKGMVVTAWVVRSPPTLQLNQIADTSERGGRQLKR